MRTGSCHCSGEQCLGGRAQKRSDVHEYHIDTFVMGDDWEGEFDFPEEEGVEVVRLPHTPEGSATQTKEDLGARA